MKERNGEIINIVHALEFDDPTHERYESQNDR
jgi:hypothetical protein